MTPIQRPPQTQKLPGEEKLMHPRPKTEDPNYQGSNKLKDEVAIITDYTATKAAGVGFTRALAHSLVNRKIRVNGVAPGPIWTPLIPASFDPKKVSEFGSQTPMGRAGEPYELAPAYVYLASHRDSSYVTGQVIHVNGGKILNT